MRRGTSVRTLAAVGLSGLLQSVAVPLASFIALPLVLSQVSLAEYGWWSALAGFAGLLALVDGGIRLFVNRHVAERFGVEGEVPADDVRRSLGLVLLTGIAVLAVVVAWRGWLIGVLIPDAPSAEVGHLELILVCLAVLLVFRLYNGVLYAYVGGLQRADLATRTVVAASIAAVTVNVAGAYLGAGIDAFLYGSIAGTVVTTVSALWSSHRLTGDRAIWRPSRPDWRQDRPMLATSMVLLVAGLLRVTDVQVGKIVTSHFLGADPTAAYTVAATLAGIGITVAVAPSAGLLTAVAECGLDQRGRKVLETSADLSGAGAALCAGGLFVLGPGLLQIWLRQEVPGADGALRWLALAVVPTSISIVASALLVAVRRERPVAVAAVVALGVNLLAAVVGAQVWGLPGVAAAMMVTYLVNVVILAPLAGGAALPVVRRALLHTAAIVPLCLAALGLDAVVGGLSGPGWFVAAGVFAIVGAGTAWWVCRPSTRLVLVGYLRRGRRRAEPSVP